MSCVRLFLRALKNRGESVSSELKQSLLELICFYNEEEAWGEDDNLTTGIIVMEKQEWKSGGLAEEIYSEERTPQARSAGYEG